MVKKGFKDCRKTTFLVVFKFEIPCELCSVHPQRVLLLQQLEINKQNFAHSWAMLQKK